MRGFTAPITKIKNGDNFGTFSFLCIMRGRACEAGDFFIYPTFLFGETVSLLLRPRCQEKISPKDVSGRRRGDGGSVTNYFSGLFGRLCNQEELPPPQHEKEEEEEGNFPSSKERKKGVGKEKKCKNGAITYGKVEEEELEKPF